MTDPDDDQLSSVLEAVGRVASHDTMLEHFLADVFEALVQTDLAPVLARGQSFETLAAQITALVDASPASPLLAEVADAIRVARNLHRERNLLVHSLWFGVAGFEDQMEAMRYRRWRTQPDTRTWTVQEVRALAKRLLDQAWYVYDLSRRLLGQGPVSPPTA